MTLQHRLKMFGILLLGGCAAPGSAGAEPALPFKTEIIADFDAPWAMAFLPDGRMLVTEKRGQLLLVAADGKARQVVSGTLPVDFAGQGGLMDVVPAPGFAINHLVYFSFSERGPGGKGVVLARGRLVESGGARLEAVEVLHRATPYLPGNGHYSGRIAFSPDGQYLFYANGERQKFTPAQDPKMSLGKVLRLTLEGKAAPGNPLAAKGFDPAIWSYGHRNILGLAFDAQGRLWEQEMGPEGGDEVNLIAPGKNYGWPRVSNGRNYGAATDDIPDHAAGDGYEPPKVSWNPVISPGGLMIYSGKLFPKWRGDAFIGGLSSQALIRVDLNGAAAAKGDQWAMGARIRDVEEGPDGAIWVLEDGGGGSQGRLLKLTPRG
ncbi:MAG: PQQ-dependent sugar dehydrogenase [Sphingomonas sp.]|uniref:PQQ-dependent sugar dehydrogenase n=1 Tax=Sphingomonas sp. TaxID=28214 RepID=UPI000DB06C74|nr:PQQ-dependent sugar dehydrogenase [Sphingomonas sp.]PZP12580.1 MAG: dehydrogenase [Sphingomonas hengshuiensis]